MIKQTLKGILIATAMAFSSQAFADSPKAPTTPKEACDLFKGSIQDFNDLMPLVSPNGVTIKSASSSLAPDAHCLITIRADVPGDVVKDYARKQVDMGDMVLETLIQTQAGQERLQQEILAGLKASFMDNKSFASMYQAAQENLALGVHIDFPSESMDIAPVGAVFTYQDFLAFHQAK